ncbi:MAG: serine--tRNA ligase, partial [Desulfobulbaceae bacterium]|nr:serine--tRNA ligase [Desulfobulbaceae bacterium]
MLELRFIRENITLVKESLKKRNIHESRINDFESVDSERRELLSEVESLRNRRKTVSQKIAGYKRDGRNADAMIKEMREVGERVKELETRIAAVDTDLNDIVMGIPNLCHESIPFGVDDSENQELRKWGEIPEFSFEPKAHYEIGELQGTIDLERAAKISGARFALLTGFASRLERALINFMLDLHTQKHGYEEVLPPFLVNT